MTERILTIEETNALLRNEMESLNSEIERWSHSVDVNSASLVGNLQEKIKVSAHFMAKMTCTVCGHEHYTNRLEMTQLETCEMAISARILNSVLGFAYEPEKIEELKEKLKKAENEEEKKKLTNEIESLENFFRVRFLCGDCAIYFQDQFKKIFDKKIIESNKKTLI